MQLTLALEKEETMKIEICREEKTAIENSFPFAQVSMIAEVESWRKEIYRPIYHLHKWWAQRLGSVFRSIIIASAIPENAPVLDLFYQRNDLEGLVVFDPFMGSGTTVGEAIKLGCTAIGRDINPVAYNVVRAAFSRISIEDAQRTFEQLKQTVGRRIKSLYRLKDGSQVLYYFWVKQVNCPDCGQSVDLFKNYIFSRNAYPAKKPQAQTICPGCGEVFETRYDSEEETCPSCSTLFNPRAGSTKRTKANCFDCGNEFNIAKTVKSAGQPPNHRLYAKMVLLQNGQKEYRRITEEDLQTYNQASLMFRSEHPLLEKISIEPGHNTNQVINYCYTRWDQFFNDRQLLALTWLGKAIKAIEDPDLRFVFSILFSGTLEFNNMFCSFKGEGTGAVRHMFSHHILKPERQPLEANLWGTKKSSGAFSTLFKSRLMKALQYRNAPFEIKVVPNGNKLSGEKKYDCNSPISKDLHIVTNADEIKPRSVYLSCGDSAETDLQPKSVDLVVTDPPFFDNVHYSELADFFYVWQRPMLDGARKDQLTTRNVKEVQDANATKFSSKLTGVFSECHRVLKDNGLLVFTYHHSREEGWSSVAHAVTAAGFRFVFAQPVKAEMSVATPKKQAKEPIDLDIILVCRKKMFEKENFLELNEAYKVAIKQAHEQIVKFWEYGKQLSRNDLRIIILSHIMVALSADRTEDQLFGDFGKLSELAQNDIESLYRLQETKFA